MQPERADMNKDLGALPGSRASTEPCSTVSALTGFDPAREGHLLLSRVECVLMDVEQARRLSALSADYRNAEVAVTAMRRAERTLVKVFEEMGGIIALRALQAIAMEARKGGDGETRLHPKDDSAGPKDIAQGPSQ